MVRMVHMNIFYKMDLQISDSKSEFLTKTENSGFRKIEKSSFGTQHLTFEVISKTEMISKYILDHSAVIPAQFPYIKILLLMKIAEHRSKSIKINIVGVGGMAGGPYITSQGR